MNLFISWSGEKSRKIGEIFFDLLPQIINHVTPWFSPESIESGSTWDAIIQNALQTDFGIVILTEENKEKPWIHFEAGALSKGLETSRVCTFLVDLGTNDLLHNPLTKFNHTENNYESICKLINTINNNLGDKKLNETMLEKSFKRIHPEMETRIKVVLESINTIVTKPPSTIEVVNELLESVREMTRRLPRIERYSEILVERNANQIEKQEKQFDVRQQRNEERMIELSKQLLNMQQVSLEMFVRQQQEISGNKE